MDVRTSDRAFAYKMLMLRRVATPAALAPDRRCADPALR